MADWIPQFYPSTDTGKKVMCTTCGRQGHDIRLPDGTIPVYPELRRWPSWMQECQAPHIHKCICGKAFPKVLGLKAHVRGFNRQAGMHLPVEEGVANG